MTTLVVVAHPDDETLGCGGTIARLAAEGEHVELAVICETRASQYIKQAVTILEGDKQIAVHTYGFPDQALDTIPLRQIVTKLEHLIEMTRPDTVYTHHPGDLNLDHVITHRAVMTACRPVAGCPVKTIYAMEIPSSTEWGQTHQFQPTVYTDITDTLERKIEAMEAYETERRQTPHPRSALRLRALAWHRGSAAGLVVAEAFQLIRQIRP